MSDCGDEDDSVVVIDNGSGLIKSGFGGEDSPRSSFHSIVGLAKYQRLVPYYLEKKQATYVGSRAQNERGYLDIIYPIEHGIVQNWDYMEKLWTFMFNEEFRVVWFDECPILLIDVPMNPKDQREKMMEKIVPIEKRAMRGLEPASTDCRTDRDIIYQATWLVIIVVDLGDGVIDVVPVHEGVIVPHGMRRLNFAGRDLTDYLMKMLNDKGCSFVTCAEREIAREIKEKLCYVALDYEAELLKDLSEVEKVYRLPDGRPMTIGTERFRVPEVLFQPSLMGFSHRGLHELVYDTLMDCEVDLRGTFATNIVIAGGTSMIPGLDSRLQSELEALVPAGLAVNVVANPNRMYAAWAGGSSFCSNVIRKTDWITKKDFDEHGPVIVHDKCLN